MVRYKMSDRILAQDVISETVLLDMDKGSYFELNEMGSAMLTHLRESGDPQQVVAALMLKYEVDEDTVTHDLNTLLSQLEEHGLVIREEKGT